MGSPKTVFVRCRTNDLSTTLAQKGRKRSKPSKGYRVQVNTGLGSFSIYPADARKIAMQLLDLADECEND